MNYYRYILNIQTMLIFCMSIVWNVTNAQFRITSNDSLNTYLIDRVSFVRSYGSLKAIDELIEKLDNAKEEKFINEIEIVKSFLYIRKYFIENNLPQLFYYFELSSTINTDNQYLNIQKNQYKGLYYLYIDSIDKAIDEFFRYATFEEMQDYYLLSISNYHAAQILFKQENYLKAKEFFMRSIPYFYVLQNRVYLLNRLQEIYSNIGLCYLRTGDIKLAYYYFRTCEEFIRLSEDYLEKNSAKFPEDELYELRNFTKEAKGVLYGNLGQLFIEKNEFLKGIELFKKSIEINSQPMFDNKDAYITASHLINAFFDKGMYDSALYYMDIYFDQILQYDIHKQIADVSFNALKYYLPKNTAKSTYYFNLYEEAKSNQKKIFKSKKFFENYMDLIDQKYALKFENEKLRQEKDLQNEKFNKIIFLIISIVLGFTVLTYFIFYTKIKHRNNTIEAYNTELQKINQELEVSNTQKSSIMGMVAHDLRGPISSIKSLNELRKNNDINTEEFDTYINRLIDNSNDVINDIIDFAKTEHNYKEKNFEETNINEVINQTLEEMKNQYQQKNISVEFNSKDVVVKTEKILFKRLIQNLLSNAIKFSHPSGRIEIRSSDHPDYISIEIQDHGIGIPEKMIEILFDPFTKASRKGTAGEPSHGLGMSIVKRIMDYHKGKISIISSVGIGTTVTVEFPKEQ